MSLSKDEIIVNLTKCLREVNENNDKLQEERDKWKKLYRDLQQEHIALELQKLCEDCNEEQRGGNLELCTKCHENNVTKRDLRKIIEKKATEADHYRYEYEALLKKYLNDEQGSFNGEPYRTQATHRLLQR